MGGSFADDYANSAGVSRRTFLKAGGLLAGASLFVGAAGLTGCAPKDNSEGTSTAEATGKASSISYTVYDTDVLVIGAGFGATCAAIEAMSKGAKVLMVDKGPYGFSGACGMNWDQEVVWPVMDPPMYAYISANDMLANQKLIKNIYECCGPKKENYNCMAWWVNMGNTTWNRLPDGSFEDAWAAGGEEAGTKIAQRGFYRHALDTVKGMPIKIVDNTMITDLFIQDGKCVGAIGYNVNTGEYRVFRAKATVASSGPCCQMYGWNDVHPFSMNTPDNTGDVDAAAYRHGCSLIGSEFFGVDLISSEPTSLGSSFNSGVGADGNHMNLLFVCDKDGDFFMRDHAEYDVSRPVRDKILEGKGGPNGEVYLDLTDAEFIDKLRPCYARNIALWKEQFGIDATEPGHKVPVKLEAFEHAGAFLIDENAESQIPGLFGTRGYGMTTDHIVQQHFVGTFAGMKAAEYAQSSQPSNLDWSSAEAEIARLDEIRTREVEDGLRPSIIRHTLQNAFYEAFEPGCNAEGLQKCIDEIERIKAEDLPRMYVADSDVTFNRDWKEAIENFNIIDMAEASARAALMREESRKMFYRTDFPEMDEENWHCNITCTLKDNQMVAERSEQVFEQFYYGYFKPKRSNNEGFHSKI